MEIIKGKALRQDLANYDGINLKGSRKDASGGFIRGLRVGDEVDVLMVYGQGESYTNQTIQNAINSLGSKSATLKFAPGTWEIQASVTVPSNLSVRVPAGAVFNVSSGVTLTFQGPVFRDSETWTSGSGTVTETWTRSENGTVNIVSAPETHNEDYTLVLTDGGKTLLKTSSDTTTRTWTIPLNSSVEFPVGTRIWGQNQDDNNLTITASGAATLIALNGATPADGDVTIAEGQKFELYKYATDAWSISIQSIALTGLTATVAELNKTDDSAAAVSGYVSGMRIYRLESGGDTTVFDVDGNVTESTFESVGPTGSGADNIWTAMDTIPAGATMVILTVLAAVVSDESGNTAQINVYARKTGDSTAKGNNNTIAWVGFEGNNLTVVPFRTQIGGHVFVPLDSSRRFDITWTAINQSSATAHIYFQGFII